MGILISVVLPVYNVAPYLPKCLDSLRNNTYQNIEIICVNDGSTDDSLRILHEYAAEDNRIVVIDKPNGGVSSARNAGVRAAKGEYISFVDPDDFVHQQYFEVLMFARDSVDADYVVGGFTRIEENEECPENALISTGTLPITTVQINGFFESHQCRTYSWGRLLRREFALDVSFQEAIHIGEDGIFNADLWKAHPDMKACFINAPVYYYVQRKDSTMANTNEAELLNVARVFQQKLDGSSLSDIIYLIFGIRRALAIRYMTTHIHPDRTLAKESHSMLLQFASRLAASNVITSKQKALHFALIYCPGMYWFYRARQPGMLRWEFIEWRKRRETRKAKN